MKQETKIKIAAIGDIHVGKTLHMDVDYIQLFKYIAQQADILVMCGDLTDRGMVSEAEELVEYLLACPIPKVAVLGNHDYTRGEEKAILRVMRESGVIMLEEEVFALENIGFAGVKGFGGGYGSHTVGAFGEDAMKQFVQEAINQAEALEVSLDRLQEFDKKIVALHYSPIPATNRGEPLEIYPFLGTSRLEEVIDRHDVSMVFHGHAHFGSPQGKTLKGTDVYNVALPVMQRTNQKFPVRIVEL